LKHEQGWNHIHSFLGRRTSEAEVLISGGNRLFLLSCENEDYDFMIHEIVYFPSSHTEAACLNAMNEEL